MVDAGMTVGTHTWSHMDLARNPYANDPKGRARNRDGQQLSAQRRSWWKDCAVLPLPPPPAIAAA